MDPELTVVIPAYKAAATIGEQLTALAEQQWDQEWEVLVIENGPPDGTAERVEAHRHLFGDRLRLIRSEQAGASVARNLGATEARAEHIAFVDSDDIVGEGWLAAMGGALRRHEFVTGPLELDRLNPGWLASSRGRATETKAPTFYGIFPYAHGCNMGFHRRPWQKVGGLDPTVTPTEDMEFSMRMWLAGSPVAFEPKAFIHYRYRPGMRQLWDQGMHYGRGRPLVARRLLAAGGGRPPRLAGWRSWLHLLRLLPGVRSAEGRALFAWTAANRLGQVIGSFEHRTLLL